MAGVKVRFSNRDIDHIEALVDFILLNVNCERTKDGSIVSKDGKSVEEKLHAEILAVLYGFIAIIENHKTENSSIFSIIGHWSVVERYGENRPQSA